MATPWVFGGGVVILQGIDPHSVIPPAGVKMRTNNEIQGGHAGPPLRQEGIVGHGPTYGTNQSGGNMIAIYRPQRGHNM